MHWEHDIHVFLALFAVMAPLGAIPLFLALTPDDPVVRWKTAVKAGLITFAILLTAFFVGDLILAAFEIEMSAFRIAGGSRRPSCRHRPGRVRPDRVHPRGHRHHLDRLRTVRDHLAVRASDRQFPSHRGHRRHHARIRVAAARHRYRFDTGVSFELIPWFDPIAHVGH